MDTFVTTIAGIFVGAFRDDLGGMVKKIVKEVRSSWCHKSRDWGMKRG